MSLVPGLAKRSVCVLQQMNGWSLPGGYDQLLALGAGIRIEVVGHDDEANLGRDVAIFLVLARSSAQAEDQEDIPRHADLEEHLEVEDAEQARVQLCAHEEIIDEATSHAMLLATPEGGEVGNNADEKATDDGDREKGSELIDGGVNGPDTRKVQTCQGSKGEVETGVGVAVIRQLLATLMRQRLSISLNTGEETVARALEDQIAPVPDPSPGMGEGTRVDEVDEVGAKVAPGLAGGPRGEFAVVVGGANPHVPHENGEEEHHGARAQGAAKLGLARVVDPRVLAGSPAIHDVGIGWDAICVLGNSRLPHALDDLAVGGTVGMTIAVAISRTIGIGIAVDITISVSVGVDIGVHVVEAIGRAIGASLACAIANWRGVVFVIHFFHEFACTSTGWARGLFRSRVGFSVRGFSGDGRLSARGAAVRSWRFYHASKGFLFPMRAVSYLIRGAPHVSHRDKTATVERTASTTLCPSRHEVACVARSPAHRHGS